MLFSVSSVFFLHKFYILAGTHVAVGYSLCLFPPLAWLPWHVFFQTETPFKTTAKSWLGL